MKVKELMTTDIKVCSPDTTAAEAAHLMWDGDCGVLPVVADGTLVGVVTDRDLFIALATQQARASELQVGPVATKMVVTCSPDDSVQTALATMKQARVRRLPVVGFGGAVLGIVSMNDLLLAVGQKKSVRTEDVIDTMQAICGHHHPAPHIVAA